LLPGKSDGVFATLESSKRLGSEFVPAGLEATALRQAGCPPRRACAAQSYFAFSTTSISSGGERQVENEGPNEAELLRETTDYRKLNCKSVHNHCGLC
jgi:hypothetical protein